jgi:hypothetical protein
VQFQSGLPPPKHAQIVLPYGQTKPELPVQLELSCGAVVGQVAQFHMSLKHAHCVPPYRQRSPVLKLLQLLLSAGAVAGQVTQLQSPPPVQRH